MRKKTAADRGLDLAKVLDYLKPEKKARAPRGSVVKKAPANLDKSGNGPVAGTTYHHSSIADDWTYGGRGRTPSAWLELIKTRTWKSLEAK